MERHHPALIALGLIWLLLASSGASATTIAHWTFEEGTPGQPATGAGTILDVAGGHHATPVGAPRYTASGADRGLDLDGRGQGAYLADDPAAFSNTALTVEAIVRLRARDGLRQIVFRGDSRAGADPFYLAVLNGGLRWYVEGPATGPVAIDVPNVALDERLHIVGTIDGATDTMNLYVNGALAGTRSTDRVPTLPLSGSARVSLGMLSDGAGQGQYLDGQIFEVRISDRALRPEEFLGAAAVLHAPGSLALVLVGAVAVRLARTRRAA